MEVGIEEKNIGNIVVRISKRFAEELTGILIKEGSKFKNMDIYIGLGALVIGFLILQLFVFSPISKRINLLEKRAKEVKKIEDLKKLEEKSRETLKELEEKKEELEKEIDELKKKVEEKRKEVEESEVGKIIKELEEKREILEREVEKLKREEEEVRKRLSAQKMEQEELKKRLDLIRQKMKKLMET
jgi:F0F1-type ATP synthase membrane subunit b/b'